MCASISLPFEFYRIGTHYRRKKFNECRMSLNFYVIREIAGCQTSRDKSSTLSVNVNLVTSESCHSGSELMYHIPKCQYYLLPPASEGWREVMFQRHLSVHICGGGSTSSQVGGGYPIPGVDEGYVWWGLDGVPHSAGGRYPIPGSGQGVPHPADRGGTPSQIKTWWGTPHPRLDGYPPVQDWMG